jgi:hypothetical protein
MSQGGLSANRQRRGDTSPSQRNGGFVIRFLVISSEMTPKEKHCENVVCDVHLTDMRFGQLRHGMGLVTKVLDGFACALDGCGRFFGTEGYCDLTEDSEFTNPGTQPCCPNQHQSERMYIQRKPDHLQWVCPVCNAVRPYVPITDRMS